MESTLTLPQVADNIQLPPIKIESATAVSSNQPGRLEKTLLWYAIKLRIFYIACVLLKKPGVYMLK